MKDTDSDKNDLQLEKIPGKSKWELKREKLLEEARQRYYDEHGRWPEEDGIKFDINNKAQA